MKIFVILMMNNVHVIGLLNAAYINGFGFQCGGVSPFLDKLTGEPLPTLVVAFIHSGDLSIDEGQETNRARLLLKSDGITVDDYLGHTYVKISLELYHRLPEVIQYFLDHGMSVTLQNSLACYYSAGSTFDATRMEQYFIQEYKKRPPNTFQFYTNKWKFLESWNWLTPEGKQFCQELRQQFPHYIDRDVDDSNFYKWPTTEALCREYRVLHHAPWINKAPEPLQAIPVKSEEPLEILCSLCEERPANTLVLPCQHCVVCKECSKKLRDTPDKSTCIQCRGVITSVEVDE
jgi:hypothetical protein